MASRKKRALTPEEQLEAALVPQDKWPYEVPDNWYWVRGAGLLKPMRTAVPTGDFFRYIDIESIDNHKQEVIEPKVMPSEKAPSRARRKLAAGDTLFSMVRPYLKNIAYIDDGLEECIASTGFYVCTPTECLDGRFLYYLMCCGYVIDGLNTFMKGDNSPSIRSGDVERFPFPLPPIQEQRRIASRVEWLFSKLDDAEAELRVVISDSDRRQSAILHNAFNGDLTAQWRHKHRGNGISSIADIAEYAKAWKAKDQRLLAEQQATCIDQNLDGHIWTKCTVGAIGRVTNGSTPSRKVPVYWDGDIPWVSSGEVRNNVISKTNECITNAGYEGSSVNLLPTGTVLIAMIGEGKTRGQSAILDIPATINQNVAAVVIDHGFVDPRFLWYWFKYSYKRNREAGSGTGPQALNCQRVRELPFILPELNEQKEIVRRLDDFIDNEQQMQTLALDALAAISTLRETILSRALRGELGTNDPNESSSKELLASIINSNAGK